MAMGNEMRKYINLMVNNPMINGNITIEKIEEKDNEKIGDILYLIFGKKINISRDELFNKVKKRLNNGISVCIKNKGEIVGVYLLNEKSINEFINEIINDSVYDFKSSDTKIFLDEKLSDNGLQGIALGVLEEYQHYGFGKKLKEYTYNLGYDYIWGVQDKLLNNINFWTNSRKIFAESSNRYATYIKLK